jgi:hypothetical protein
MSLLAQHPWVAVAIGTVMVGTGGLIATWGWNKASELQYQKNLVSSVIYEWRLNDQSIEDALSLAKRWNKRGDKENFSYQPYKAERLNALISSGVIGDSQRLLVGAIRKYESAIGDSNAYMRIAGRHNPGLFIKAELIHNPSDEMPAKEEDLLAQSFLTLLEEHRRVGNMLADQYSTLFSQAVINLE